MLEAHPEFDPHGLKHQGEHSAKHAHVNEPYVFQKFPLTLYKTEGEGSVVLNYSCTVKDEAELEAAKGAGFNDPSEPPAKKKASKG